MAEHDDLLLAERAAKIIGHFDSVLRDSVEGDVWRLCAIAAVCVPSAALIPLDDSERFFPRLILVGRHPLRLAWSPVHHQQHGIAALIAANADPLIDAADRNERGLLDPGGRAYGRDGRRDED